MTKAYKISKKHHDKANYYSHEQIHPDDKELTTNMKKRSLKDKTKLKALRLEERYNLFNIRAGGEYGWSKEKCCFHAKTGPKLRHQSNRPDQELILQPAAVSDSSSEKDRELSTSTITRL